MFSETIFINHGRKESICVTGLPTQDVRESRSESCESYSGPESGSVYKSHVVQRNYSVERQHQGSPESVQEVSCFVRSEIKWVFLKNVKVQTQTITQQATAMIL